MKLILVTLIFCFNTGECSQKQVQIEPKVCSLGTLQAKFPHNGQWKDGTATVKC